MNLIPYTEFAKLRLQQFEPTAENWEPDEDDSANLEWMDSLWFDQDAVPYVEFMRHQDDPQRVGAICLNLDCEPADLVSRILTAIHLPLRRDMKFEELTSLLGPSKVFLDDVHDFMCGTTDQYLVRCSLRDGDGDGLHKVAIMRKDLLPADYAD